MFSKQFKDPIYGYIEIDASIVADIIDTPAFQRLKDIRQTSYTPLFPAAYHNRYVHSLGVYHLGRIAFHAIKPQLIEKSETTHIRDQIEKISEIFELACLLHDIGHAPFSHTGETFFLNKDLTLYKELKNCVNDDGFAADFDALGTLKPAPHECMSCIVGLSLFPNLFTSPKERSLFARCIIGMSIRFSKDLPDVDQNMLEDLKKEITRQRKAIKSRITALELINCVISLLNSSIIDVDRLDYIIRDAATIGFKNVQIDYMRLLKGMRIVDFNGEMRIGYHKSAISVIESAIYAHDSEKKWIQSHPSILYEMAALQNAMESLTTIFYSKEDPNPIFCYDALTEKGKNVSLSIPLFSKEAEETQKKTSLWSSEAERLITNGNLFSNGVVFDKGQFRICTEYSLSLLADEDILYLMKHLCKKGLGYEYFSRNCRRTAVWKSEAEFRALFQTRIGDDTTSIRTLETDFDGLVNYCQNKTGAPIVNKEIIRYLSEEESNAEKALADQDFGKEYYDRVLRNIVPNKHWVNILMRIADDLNIEPEFLIVFQKKFSSSFKPAVREIPILFPNLEISVVPFEKVVNVLQASPDRKSNFFHLYYKPIGTIDDQRKKTIVNTIARTLIREVNYK